MTLIFRFRTGPVDRTGATVTDAPLAVPRGCPPQGTGFSIAWRVRWR